MFNVEKKKRFQRGNHFLARWLGYCQPAKVAAQRYYHHHHAMHVSFAPAQAHPLTLLETYLHTRMERTHICHEFHLVGTCVR